MGVTVTTEAIAVGAYVRNKLSAIKGYVATRTENINGYIWLGVQPAAKEDATEEPKIVYGDECEWEEDAAITPVARPDAPREAQPIFALGAKVRDSISGFEGIVTSRVEHLNRCWGYDLTHTKDRTKDGKTVLEYFLGPRLRLLKAPEVAVKSPVRPTPTGPSHYTSQRG